MPLHLAELTKNYLTVYDHICKQYTCNKVKFVNTAWIPDKTDKFPCDVCTAIDCRINIINRDCNTLTNKLFYRKIVSNWTRHYRLMDLC